MNAYTQMASHNMFTLSLKCDVIYVCPSLCSVWFSLKSSITIFMDFFFFLLFRASPFFPHDLFSVTINHTIPPVASFFFAFVFRTCRFPLSLTHTHTHTHTHRYTHFLSFLPLSSDIYEKNKWLFKYKWQSFEYMKK